MTSLESAVEAEPCAVLGVDRAGIVTTWSGAASAWTGYPALEAIGQNVELIVPVEYREQHREGLRRAMDGGPRSADAAPFHLPVRRADGEIVVFAARFVFLDDASARPAGACVILASAMPGAEPWTPVVGD